VIGLETAFAVCYDTLVRRKTIDLARLIELFSTGPARVFRLPGGSLKRGSIGDVTIVDPEGTTDVKAPFVSKAMNSPFTGMSLRGRVAGTIVGGVVKYDARRSDGAKARRHRR